MYNYNLIALDLDGTLLNEEKRISKKNKQMIEAAIENGKKVVLATGRPLPGVQKYLSELNLLSDDDFVVVFNGAMVQKVGTGEIVSMTTLKKEDYLDLYALSLKLGVNIHALTECAVTTPKNNPYTEVESSLNGIPTIEKPVNEIQDETIVKVMFVDDPKKLDEIFPLIPEEIREKYTIVRSAPIFLEFLHKTVNKGTGVDAVAKHLGMKPEEVICVGDAGNDKDMIEYAGLGVAMGNAFEEVKLMADYVTKTNEEDGVAHVIQKFMLNERSA